jgi:hypothetical protein
MRILLFFSKIVKDFFQGFFFCANGIDDENCEVLFIERDDDNRHFFFVMNDE